MKALFAVALLAASPLLAGPGFAAARPYHSYGASDPCTVAKTRAANNGAVTGAVLGAVVGGAMASGGGHLQAAAAGGNTGAKTGQSVGAHSVKCVAYPARYHPRRDCRWIEEATDTGPHQFEVCRGRDGQWTASGRRL